MAGRHAGDHLGGWHFLVASLEGIPIHARVPALWTLAIGLELALLSGLAAWFNWGRHVIIHEEWNDPWMLFETDRWPKSMPDKALVASYWASIVFGLLAAASLLVAGYFLTSALAEVERPGPITSFLMQL